MFKINSKTYGKIKGSVSEAMKPIRSGMSVMIGGFGLCGIPVSLLEYLS